MNEFLRPGTPVWFLDGDGWLHCGVVLVVNDGLAEPYRVRPLAWHGSLGSCVFAESDLTPGIMTFAGPVRRDALPTLSGR